MSRQRSKAKAARARRDPGRTTPPPRPLSMHENVEDWCDCCACEAEPRWRALEDAVPDDAPGRELGEE